MLTDEDITQYNYLTSVFANVLLNSIEEISDNRICCSQIQNTGKQSEIKLWHQTRNYVLLYKRMTLECKINSIT